MTAIDTGAVDKARRSPATTGRSSRSRRPTPTAHAALVLLAFGDASGYELKQRADRTLRFFFNAPAMSQLYTELDRLAGDGLVSVERTPRGATETRRYGLTEAGVEALRRWLDDDDVAPTVFKSHLALRLVVGYLVGSERMRADLDTEWSRVRADLDALDAVRETLPPADPQFGWAWLVANWGDRYFRDLLGQLDELTELLDDPGARATPSRDRRLDGEGLSLVPIDRTNETTLDAIRAIRAEPQIAAIWPDVGPRWPDEPADAALHGYAVVVPDHTVAGFVQWYEETDPQYHHAGIDIFVAPAQQGRGTGTATIRLLAAHLFGDRGIHRLVIDPAADNAAAIACYRKVGFRPVGVMRRYERGADGTFHDGLLMDLLPEDLEALQ